MYDEKLMLPCINHMEGHETVLSFQHFPNFSMSPGLSRGCAMLVLFNEAQPMPEWILVGWVTAVHSLIQ